MLLKKKLMLGLSKGYSIHLLFSFKRLKFFLHFVHLL
jgi:hypothetical protein